MLSEMSNLQIVVAFGLTLACVIVSVLQSMTKLTAESWHQTTLPESFRNKRNARYSGHWAMGLFVLYSVLAYFLWFVLPVQSSLLNVTSFVSVALAISNSTYVAVNLRVHLYLQRWTAAVLKFDSLESEVANGQITFDQFTARYEYYRTFFNSTSTWLRGLIRAQANVSYLRSGLLGLFNVVYWLLVAIAPHFFF